jgi:predicted transcriptional regulator
MRRDKLKILAGILEICEGSGVNKTKIVYGSNINFKVADVYIDMLIRENLMEVIAPGPREMYRTTVKGKELIRNIKEIYDRLEKYSLE